jgi:hypothetical protein
MLAYDQFKTIAVQVGVFTQGLQLFVPRIVARMEGFDGPPTVFPFGNEVPAQVPRIVLTSMDGQRKFQASSERADVLFGEDPLGIDTEAACRFALEAIDKYLEITRAIVGRLTFNEKLLARSESPAKELAVHFCKERWLAGPLNRPANFELHAHKEYRLADRWNVNSWIRCKTAQLVATGDPIITIEQDLNTLATESESNEFGLKDVREFVSASRPEMAAILRQYFPKD